MGEVRGGQLTVGKKKNDVFIVFFFPTDSCRFFFFSIEKRAKKNI